MAAFSARWRPVAAAALVAAACTSTHHPPHPAAVPTTVATTRPATTTAVPPRTTTSATAQTWTAPALAWTPCDNGRQCATLDVPLDYGDIAGPHIGIALERRAALDPSARIGSLVVDPGGPGESGILNLSKDISVLPAGVAARFDIVGFDARGIGKSSPIHCNGDVYSGPEADPVPQSPAAQQMLLEVDKDYAQACLQSSGALLLAHVGTLDVARDLDVMRRALGDAGLTFVGLSYGTLVGATYAELFPTHVRAMVLDGALDPSLSTAAFADAQAQGFETSLDAFFGWCAAAGSGCAWHPVGDPHAAFQQLADRVRTRPLPVGVRTVGPAEFYTGTFGSLYARSFWPNLGRALAGVAAGQGAGMEGLYDGYERTGDPSFSGDANSAITCLDHPVPTDPAQYPALAAAAASGAPDFGPLFAWSVLECAVWPVPSSAFRTVARVSAAGSPAIVVVGTTGDPATPYAWAQSLAAQLQRGVLLTRTGVDHVAIFYSSCVRALDDAYLVSLQVPGAGTVCPS